MKLTPWLLTGLALTSNEHVETANVKISAAKIIEFTEPDGVSVGKLDKNTEKRLEKVEKENKYIQTRLSNLSSALSDLSASFSKLVVNLHEQGLKAPGCPKHPGWCNHTGSVYEYVDCNGDGVLDHTCRDASGDKGVILAGDSDCKVDTWPNATASDCLAAFNGNANTKNLLAY